jgi:branched-subunit amino acid aminotransferase/4-amino-4-deoxychorismate lyase
MKSKIIFNGKILNQQDIQFNTIKRAINFGDGFFETIRIVNGDLLFIESHLKRIFKALKILKISNSENFNSEIIKAKIKELLLHNKIDSGGRVKIYFFRSGLGTYLPVTNEISFIIECFHLENNLYQLNKKGFLVDIFYDYQKQINNLSAFKTSNSLLYVLASIYANDNDLNDTLILNEKKYIIESSNSNIFLFLKDSIITPALNSGCIAGIMREEIIKIINFLDIKIIERDITLEDLMNSKEIFLTNVISGINWVGGYKKTRYYNTLSKKIIKELNNKISYQ